MAEEDDLSAKDDDLAQTGSACPICASPGIKKYRPFCSKRCADIDLSKWLGGTYAVPVVQIDEADAHELERFIEEEENKQV